ncbi:hypothetical protein [Gimesia sp.]|uniref:hypothetical protein n=1 Tax=Gimesia sp. TaxID=2024833 RepID=UPI003A936889
MQFGNFLLQRQKITWEEYQKLIARQHGHIVRDQKFNDFLEVSYDLSNRRLNPFGEVLRHSKIGQTVADRHLQTIDEFITTSVEEWWKWHLDSLEPLGIYSTASRYGAQLYVRDFEKKCVGELVANTKVRSNHTASIVRNGDNVVIPDGSSSAYAGLAIAAFRENVRITTSNDILIREMRDNPCVARAFHRGFTVIGGEADFDASSRCAQHGGCFEVDAQKQFECAISNNPKATVVVISVNGLLPDDGPFSKDGDTYGVKKQIIDSAIEANVREIVFVADYTKHQQNNREQYGIPIYATPRDWRSTVENNYERISIVTAPPPEIRNHMNSISGSIQDRDLRALEIQELHKQSIREYDQAAKAFDSLLRNSPFEDSRFHEAILDGGTGRVKPLH